MGRNRSVKRQNFEKREEEKANRLFKMICIVLILLAILMIVGYTIEYAAGNRTEVSGA